jgi:RNA polymerase sigma-70 factor, ECF subfamily
VEDRELVARLRAGDQAAFAAVVRAWSPAMLRVARAHVRTHAVAEEVVQDAWLGVLRALDGYEGRARLRTWVFRILLHTARRRGGREARRPDGPPVDPAWLHDADGARPGHLHGGGPEDGGPEAALLADELRDALAHGLAGLPERQRTVVALRDVHGLDADEVCALLDLSPANQRVLLHRGRSRLRTALGPALV